MVQIFNQKFSSDLNNLQGAICGCMDALIKSGKISNEEDIFDLKVILNELLINAACHGNKWNPDSLVCVNGYFYKNRYILICVEDEGPGFDYSCILSGFECKEANETKKECGRGLIIVKNLCSRIRFNKRGNKVRVIKVLGN